MALTNKQLAAMIARRSRAKAQHANDNAKPQKRMHARLLAMCVEAGGFDQNARYA